MTRKKSQLGIAGLNARTSVDLVILGTSQRVRKNVTTRFVNSRASVIVELLVGRAYFTGGLIASPLELNLHDRQVYIEYDFNDCHKPVRIIGTQPHLSLQLAICIDCLMGVIDRQKNLEVSPTHSGFCFFDFEGDAFFETQTFDLCELRSHYHSLCHAVGLPPLPGWAQSLVETNEIIRLIMPYAASLCQLHHLKCVYEQLELRALKFKKMCGEVTSR